MKRIVALIVIFLLAGTTLCFARQRNYGYGKYQDTSKRAGNRIDRFEKKYGVTLDQNFVADANNKRQMRDFNRVIKSVDRAENTYATGFGVGKMYEAASKGDRLYKKSEQIKDYIKDPTNFRPDFVKHQTNIANKLDKRVTRLDNKIINLSQSNPTKAGTVHDNLVGKANDLRTLAGKINTDHGGLVTKRETRLRNKADYLTGQATWVKSTVSEAYKPILESPFVDQQ